MESMKRSLNNTLLFSPSANLISRTTYPKNPKDVKEGTQDKKNHEGQHEAAFAYKKGIQTKFTLTISQERYAPSPLADPMTSMRETTRSAIPKTTNTANKAR